MDPKLIIEFIGTFFLVLTVALTGEPIAIGGVLIALVYMGGYISGANYNPAVTLALYLNNKIEKKLALKYVAVQMVAGLIASSVYLAIAGKYFTPGVPASQALGQAFLVEVFYTFLLCTVILHVAATDKVKDNQYYGLAIGLTLMVAAFAGGSISGGAFNPAVGVSPLIFDISNLSSKLMDVSLYLIGPLTGAVLAGLIYQFTHKKPFFIFR
ncbi:aquaporin [soil metagenome]